MIRGDHIDFVLEADGGGAPYRWEAAPLPADLLCRPWGAIHGVVRANPVNVVRLIVEDAYGNRTEREVRMIVEDLPHPPEGFVAVRGGPFWVGYQPNQPRDAWLNWLHERGYPIDGSSASREWPAGTMHLDGFYILQFEVTNQQYAEFVRATGRRQPTHWDAHGCPRGAEWLPVVNVGYEDAVAYCEWRTQQARQGNQPWEFRLPTVWEWEKAAKGPPGDDPLARDGGGRLYPFGDAWMDNALFDANQPGNAAVDVRQYANDHTPYGVRDMGGNVAEWVDGGEVRDGRIWKYVRGASWGLPGQLYALTFHVGTRLVDPEYRDNQIGFRCVAKLIQTPSQALVPLGNHPFVDGKGERVHIGRFYMSRFAVSNREFAEFRPNHRFREQERDWPVTDVSYQDALEFCAWKTNRDGRVYTLPNRYEWECAVRGAEGRRYPWGNEYSRYRCNSLESRWGHPIEVWSLWEGATPEGIYHLCGNTFEWLLGEEAVGGSWLSTCEGFGAPPYDDGAANGQGRADIGFRYVTH